MNSIRVHSAEQDERGRFAYLVLAFLEDGRVTFDFTSLLEELPSSAAAIILSPEAFRDLVLGREVFVSCDEGLLAMRPHQEMLEVTFQPEGTDAMQTRRVWRAEVALGWNVFTSGSVDEPPAEFR